MIYTFNFFQAYFYKWLFLNLYARSKWGLIGSFGVKYRNLVAIYGIFFQYVITYSKVRTFQNFLQAKLSPYWSSIIKILASDAYSEEIYPLSRRAHFWPGDIIILYQVPHDFYSIFEGLKSSKNMKMWFHVLDFMWNLNRTWWSKQVKIYL